MHDDLLGFRDGKAVLILKLGDSGTVADSVRIHAGVLPFATDYQLSEDNKSLLAASITSRNATLTLRVHEIELNGAGFGTIKNHFSLTIPDEDSHTVSIRDPYVAVNTESYKIIVNWRKKTGMRLQIQDFDPELGGDHIFVSERAPLKLEFAAQLISGGSLYLSSGRP